MAEGAAISRWCAAAEPEIWTSLGLNGDPDEDFPVDQRRRCEFERRHDTHHIDCCASDNEKESWACTCPCHSGDTAVHARGA